MTTPPNESLVVSRIIFFGELMILACDGKCTKAWGINNRPSISFDEDDPDDMAFLADDELGDAPKDPGTYEGGHGKPANPVHNKWCTRECERSSLCEVSKFPSGMELKSFKERLYNQPWEHENN
jgi:hypothetical protein